MSEPALLVSKSSGSSSRRHKKSRQSTSTRISKLEKQLRCISTEPLCSSMISADAEDLLTRQSAQHNTIDQAETTSIKASRKRDATNWKAKAQQLEIELAALRMHSGGLLSELRTTKETLKQEHMALQVLETYQLDIRHDLDEAHMVQERLERENVILRRKLQKRDSDNESLQHELNLLKGVSPEPDFPFEFEESQSSLFHSRSNKGKSMWSLLADSLKDEDALGSPTLSRSPTVDSSGQSGLFGSFSRGSHRSLPRHVQENALVA
jgi:hypothetical protein